MMEYWWNIDNRSPVIKIPLTFHHNTRNKFLQCPSRLCTANGGIPIRSNLAASAIPSLTSTSHFCEGRRKPLPPQRIHLTCSCNFVLPQVHQGLQNLQNAVVSSNRQVTESIQQQYRTAHGAPIAVVGNRLFRTDWQPSSGPWRIVLRRSLVGWFFQQPLWVIIITIFQSQIGISSSK